MKKISNIVVFVLSFLLFSLHVSAKEIAVINGTDVRFRTSMDTSTTSNIIGAYNYGEEFELLDKSAGSNNACSKWYKVTHNGQTGYICGEFATIKEIKEEVINPDDYKEYSDYLKELGFPDSYITYLIKLHNDHPEWQFKPYKVNMTFDKMVNLEYNGYSEGWSLFEDTGRYYDGYKATDSWAYNYLTDVFRSNYEGGGVNRWYAPNKTMLGFYLDPRNFLNEKQVFMFETLSYNNVYHTTEGIEAMLKGTFMNGLADNEHTYVDAFTDAAKKYNVSPYVLISRVIQEVGANGSTITSGKVSGYEGYYNFYNIQAYGNSNAETIANGLKYAKSKDWNTHYKAIVGGAAFLADSYINAGQDTLYSQKWDIVGPNYIGHQYMQNIQAPASESIKTYNGYNKVKLLDSNFMFVIPVYNDMPSKTNMPDRGNPNNYLKNIKINNTVIFDTSSNKTDYDITLSGNVTTIKIEATPVNSKASINGLGTATLDKEKETIKLVVTAENGDTRNYTVNIIRKMDNIVIEIDNVLKELKMNYDDNYLYGFKVGTKLEEITEMLHEKEKNLAIEYLDKDNKTKNEGIIATGDTIKIKANDKEKTLKFIVYGDTNSDGAIDKLDYLQVLRYYYKYIDLDEIYKKSADVNKDGNIDKLDYLAILRDFYNYSKIEQ